MTKLVEPTTVDKRFHPANWVEIDIAADEVVTIKQTMAILKFSRSFTYAEMDAGRLGYCRFGKRARRIPLAEIRRYIAEHTTRGDSK